MSKTANPKGWMGSRGTWSPPLPQALPGYSRESSPTEHLLLTQHIALSAADGSSRSLRISTAAISIPTCTKSVLSTTA